MKRITILFSLMILSGFLLAQTADYVWEPGITHIPTVGNETYQSGIPVPNGMYHKIVAEVDVTVTDWNPDGTDQVHSIFWLYRKQWNQNTFGYINLFGPDNKKIKYTLNVDCDCSGIPAWGIKNVSAAFTTNTKYFVRYTFDAANKSTSIAVYKYTNIGDSQPQATAFLTGNLSNLTALPDEFSNLFEGQGFKVWMGHGPDESGPEVPTYGWTYENLKFTFYGVNNNPGNDVCSNPFLFSKHGTFFTPSVAEPKIRYTFDANDNITYRSIEIDMDVTIDQWDSQYPFGDHNIFWLNRGTTYKDNSFGWVTVRGPDNNQLRMAHNAGNGPTGADTHIETDFTFIEGNTYHFKYNYDVKAGRILVQVLEEGTVVKTIRDVTNTSDIHVDTEDFLIEFGHNTVANANDTLSPSYGWNYSNLRVVMQPEYSNEIRLTSRSYESSCPSCTDGQAEVFAEGDFSPFTYLWNDAGAQTNALATDLNPDDYIVRVTDTKGCFMDLPVTLNSVDDDRENRLQPYSDNGNFWEFNKEPVMLLGGNPWDNSWQVQDQQNFLDSLQLIGGNYVRCVMSHYQSFNIRAYEQTGGLYDLEVWNEDYWSQFENYLQLAEERGIMVHITIWDRFEYYKTQWDDSPWRPANNSNYSTSIGLSNTYSQAAWEMGNPFFETYPELADIPALLYYQELFISKLLSHSMKYKNVMYNMGNEHNIEQQAWCEYWARFVHNQANVAGYEVNITTMYDDQNWTTVVNQPDLYTHVAGAKVGSQWTPAGEPQYDVAIALKAEMAPYGERPLNAVKVRTQNIVFNAQERLWRLLMAGFAALSHHMTEGGLTTDGYPIGGLGFTPAAKLNVTAMRLFTDRITPWLVEPAQGLLLNRDNDEAYCVSDNNLRYGVYFPTEGQVDLDLSGNTQSFDVTWIDIFNGTVFSTSTVSGGSAIALNTPGPGSWTVTFVVQGTAQIVDAGITAIVYPTSNITVDTLFPIATVQNFGNVDLTYVNVRYMIDGGSPVIYPWNGTLAPGETVDVNLPASAIDPGTHTIKVFTINPNNIGSPEDDNAANDSLNFIFTVSSDQLADVEVVSIAEPFKKGCQTDIRPLIVIKNVGTSELIQSTIAYTIDDGPAVSLTYSVPAGFGLMAGGAMGLNGELSVVSTGLHTIKIWSELPNNDLDADASNDTLTSTFEVTDFPQSIPYTEDFESVSIGQIPDDWSMYNPDANTRWFVYANVTNRSVVIDNFSYVEASNSMDHMTLPVLDFTGFSNVELSFDYAHASQPGQVIFDSLEVMISTDCGETFTSIWYRGGANLNTVPDLDAIYVPSGPQDYQNIQIDLSTYISYNSVMVRFVNWSNNGNSTLIDNVNIHNYTDIKENSSVFTFEVYPVPANESLTFEYTINEPTELHYKLISTLGQIIYSENLNANSAGTFTQDLNISEYPSGAYHLILSTADDILQRKILIIK